MVRARILAPAGALLSLLLLAACGGEGEQEAPPFVAGRVVNLQEEAPLHPGPRPAQRLVTARNPFAGDAAAERNGERLFDWYNCADCHGPQGGGGIGPPLRDADWIYGGDAASIYQSIAQGRANGMPQYGGMVPEQEIWMLVTYLQALSGGGAGPESEQGAEQTVGGTEG